MVHPLLSQERTTRFQHLTMEDGLPQNMVDCILRDSHGFMWFGTWNGLCRYDGYKIDLFNNESKNFNSLKNNFIYALREDQFGNIWVGTKEGLYVYLYDKNEFRFINQLIDQSEPLEGSINVISHLKNNTFWIGTDKGIVHLRIVDDQGKSEKLNFYGFGEAKNNLSGESVRAIAETTNGLWIGTDEGINILSPKSHAFKKLSFVASDNNSLSFDVVHCIYQDKANNIWVGTDYGLNRFNEDSDNFTRYFHQPSESLSLPHNSITDIVEDQSGRLFFSTLGGLGEYIGENNFRSYKSELKKEHHLNNDFLNCLFSDNHGNLWIGTERGGINIYNTRQNVLEYFEYDKGNRNSLSHNAINSIFEDENFIWIGTAGGGLNRYDKRNKTFKHYLFDVNDTNSISSNFVTAIHRDKSGRLWVATWGAGINLVNEDSNDHQSFISNRNTNDTPFILSNTFIAAIVEDTLGNLWIGTNGGLFKYDIYKEQLNRISQEINAVGCLAFDSQFNLWVGSPNGLYHISLDSSGRESAYNTTHYIHDVKDSTSLSGNYITAVTMDVEGTIWSGTYGQGINKLIVSNGKKIFKSYSSTHGIANNIIYGIIEDEDNKLWISTDNGLTRFDPKTGSARSFYIADGLLNNQYYWSAHYKNDSGKLYFGGMNGLNTFYPAWINNHATDRRAVITDFKLFNEHVIPGMEYNGIEILNTNISKAKSLNMSYKSKVISFEFSSLDYNEPDLIKYAYFLEGFDEGWTYVNSTRRFANYTNLKPGNYTFMVKASGLDGSFSSPPTTIDLYIAPPFWGTRWFRIVAGLFMVGFVIAYHRYRVYKFKIQKLELERQVKERTEKINHQNHELSVRALQLKESNQQLEKKQLLIKGQNDKLELQNEHILHQRNKLIELNKKVKLVSQLKLSFFTNVSHEFRTPLTLIIGPLENLLKNQNLDFETKKTLGLINRNAQRLLYLINQIMDFRRIEKGRMALKVGRGNIKEFSQNIFNAFQPLADINKIKFEYVVDDQIPVVWFDHQKIENIIYNLLSNAFKYTPEMGSIKVEVAAITHKESKLENENLEPDMDRSVISIKISDSGIGISKEKLPLVFKRFYRIDSAAVFQINGSGIGLTLAEELIKTHHGNIFVESTPGEGSMFEIQFPCLKDAYSENERLDHEHNTSTIHKQVQMLTDEFGMDRLEKMPTQQPISIDKNKPVLLVVEDNWDLRKFMSHRFSVKYHVIEAENGKMALQLAKEQNPDIIVSDVMMPEMNGLELCTQIKGDIVTSHIPIILLTAKSEVENRIEGLEKGADDYVAKPFNFDLLEARIHNLIESRKHLRKLFIQQSEVDERQLASTVRDQKFLEQAIRIVEDKMTDPSFGAKDLVKEMGMSRSLLHKKLTALTDQSATEFINHFRLKKSLKLLKTTDMNISEIAYSVGYNDPKYFSRIFSRQYGDAPKEFLQNAYKSVKGA